ncbi:MAG: MmcQ/YjbR family DNA-binding protein [Bacteroidia bacterium]
MPETTECLPFDEDTLVFKVAGKMFALMSISEQGSVNLKCDPEYAVELREHHSEITAGYHMNKKHWNTVDFRGKLSEKLVLELVKHSFDLVVQSLKKADRERVLNINA